METLTRSGCVMLALMGMTLWQGTAAANDSLFTVTRTVSGMPRTLYANHAQTEFVFHFDDKDAVAPPILSLSWSMSAALQGQRPTLTVRLDGEPVDTFFLEEVEERTRVRLPSMESGFHVVQLVAGIQYDACDLDTQRDRWISIGEAEISWQSTEAPQATVSATFARLLQKPQRRVRLHVPLDGEPSAVEALIELDNWVRRLGGRPVATTPKDADVAVQFLGRGPCEAEDVVTVRARGPLQVAACTPKSVARFFAFVEERALSGCHKERCHYGTDAFSATEARDDDNSTQARFSLQELGRPHGWTARGEGEHAFEVMWIPPANVELHRWPEFELQATWAAPQSRQAQSHVRVELNGRPIASWELSEANQGRLVARIPAHHFDEEVWKFRTTVHLRSDVERCATSDQNALWFQVSESSELRVTHDQHYFEGLSQVWLEHRDQEIDVALTSASPAQSLAVAAVVYGLRTEQSRVRVAPSCAERTCVRLAPVPASNDTPVSLIDIDGTSFWRVRLGSAALRLLPINESVFAHARNKRVIDVYASSRLTVQKASIESLQLAAQSTSSAFYLDQQWQSAGAATPRIATIQAHVAVDDAPKALAARTTESRTVARVDAALGGVGLLTVGWAAFGRRRKKGT